MIRFERFGEDNWAVLQYLNLIDWATRVDTPIRLSCYLIIVQSLNLINAVIK